MLHINVMTKNICKALKQRRFREKHRSPVLKEAMERRVQANRRYRGKFPEKYQLVNRINNLKRSGWTLERVDEFVEKQGNCCAICRAPFSKVKRHADHEHTESPKPRGLLCALCNKGLGQFLDSPDRLEAAAVYLRVWGK